jgi:CheY-like chemotaxis protein
MSQEILIVDDEADIRDLVAGILEDEGYKTRIARNADEALQAIESAPAASAVPRHLAAGQPAGRPATARCDQAACTRTCRW